MNLNTAVKKILLFCFCFVFLASAFGQENSNVFLSLTSTNNRFDIALLPFKNSGANGTDGKILQLINKTIENDLVLSRYFNVIKTSFVSNYGLQAQMDFWKASGASALVDGEGKITGANISISIQLYDIKSKELIWKQTFSGKASSYRILSHKISNEIVRRFTGEDGIALSKIAFINDGTKFKELYTADYDGHNLRRLTRDNKLNVLPKWAPSGAQIIYTSYLFNNPDLFSLNLSANKRSVVSKYQGLNTAAAYSPDGQRIVLTLSRGSYPNLYMIDARGQIVRKMTDGYFIDTSPSFAPNGQEIVFISDRMGYPQLYIMNVSGGNVRRLPANGYCDSPAWSPRGDKIVFTMRIGNSNYDIYIYDLRTSNITKLTQGNGNNEDPVWSPDGRFVAFSSTRGGKREIYIMSIDGLSIRKLAEIAGNSYTPSWSVNIEN
ncbi:MAG: Tol-Pal system beta propeller repeat protein TolB [Elusimicrobiota bacterium]|nr:Tol-Pal system beta propeller repeat protein TolB [Elusimicrobiota bacterium]